MCIESDEREINYNWQGHLMNNNITVLSPHAGYRGSNDTFEDL